MAVGHVSNGHFRDSQSGRILQPRLSATRGRLPAARGIHSVAKRPGDAAADGRNLAPDGRRKRAGQTGDGTLVLIFFRFAIYLDRGCLVQNQTQQGIMDFQIAVVIDESELPKFIHECAHL
jgi:hypothetical protein